MRSVCDLEEILQELVPDDVFVVLGNQDRRCYYSEKYNLAVVQMPCYHFEYDTELYPTLDLFLEGQEEHERRCNSYKERGVTLIEIQCETTREGIFHLLRSYLNQV